MGERATATAEPVTTRPETPAGDTAVADLDPWAPLTTHHALRLQRAVGNRSVCAILRRPAVQRETKTGGSVEIGTELIKLAGTAEVSKEFDVGKATITPSLSAAVSAELAAKTKEKPAAGGSVEGKTGGVAAKATLNLYRDTATKAGNDAIAEAVKKEFDSGDWEIDSIDLEGSLEVEADGATDPETGMKGDKVSGATGVKITFKNGQSTLIAARLFATSATQGLEGPAIILDHKIPFPDAKLWENQDATLTAKGEIGLKVEVQPDWKEIAVEIGKKGGREILKQWGRGVLQALSAEFFIAGGFVAGGLATVVTAFKAISTGKAVRDTVKAATAAPDLYAAGFVAAFGPGKGSSPWFQAGLEAGGQRRAEMITEIQDHPAFAVWKFSRKELAGAIDGQATKRRADIYGTVEAEVRPRIHREYIRQFFESQRDWNLDYIAYNDTKKLARGLGVTDLSFLDYEP